MSSNATLRIHTQLRPEETVPIEVRPSRRKRRMKPGRTGAGDRLLRNSAIACAVLLGILALSNVQKPWAQKAAEGIERALSMHINLDDSIGELTFVRRIMPESALVFLNVSGSSELTLPADGDIAHPWSSLQPWLVLRGENRPVYAPAAGTVSAVSALSDGRSGLLIDHGEGLESLVAGLDTVTVQTGDAVSRAQQLGSCEGDLYFELRQDGQSVDPTERLGL